MILITGGLGYIGSHTAVELINLGHDIIILDNLSNSSLKILDQIYKISNVKPHFIEGDVRDKNLLRDIFIKNNIDEVIHFAGLKSINDSVNNPNLYYENNIVGSLSLFSEMNNAEVYKLVFSSSATVYGQPKCLPISEDHDIGNTTNPYGFSKYVIENMTNDLFKSNKNWRIVNLRYFNPVGAHQSGLIGENPSGTPNNLFPYICKVATKELEVLKVYGNDYNTKDGTGIRDYIHVSDLASGHIQALNMIRDKKGVYTYNLGTGIGYSVLEVINSFNQASKDSINYVFAERREGDISECYADPSSAMRDLNWKPSKSLNQMVEDSLNWQKNYPKGL